MCEGEDDEEYNDDFDEVLEAIGPDKNESPGGTSAKKPVKSLMPEPRTDFDGFQKKIVDII